MIDFVENVVLITTYQYISVWIYIYIYIMMYDTILAVFIGYYCSNQHIGDSSAVIDVTRILREQKNYCENVPSQIITWTPFHM